MTYKKAEGERVMLTSYKGPANIGLSGFHKETFWVAPCPSNPIILRSASSYLGTE